MADIGPHLAMLQYGDSFFPSGSVSFSWGLEAMTACGAVTDADGVQSFVLGQLHARWGAFDRAIVAAAHAASPVIEDVVAIDQHVEALTSAAELRSASRRMGDTMLSVFGRLEFEAANTYRSMIRKGSAFGHLAVMQGYLWARAGLSEADALALSAHTFSVGLLGAGIRLGCLTHIDAQRMLAGVRREAGLIAQTPAPSLDEISSYGLEAEIAIMGHAANETRMFAN